MRVSSSMLYSMYARPYVACAGATQSQSSPNGKLQWVAGPHPSESTPEVRGVWGYPLEAASPSKPTK
jgi:hypothetical protein